MICDFTYNVCICWCVWVKKEYVKSALQIHLHSSFTSLVNSFRSLILHTMPTQQLSLTLFTGEAVRSLQVMCSHSVHFSRYTLSIQMLQEV